MSVNRRALMAGAAATGVAGVFSILTRPAHAAEFNYRFANNQALNHPTNLRARAAAAAIREESDGRLVIRIFPSSQLGADTDMLNSLRSGGLEMLSLSPLILAGVVPNAALNGIGFAFQNYDQVWKAMDGPLGAYVRSEIAAKGLLAFDRIWDNGFRQITSARHPIETSKDLEGFRIRVPVGPLWSSMFLALGAKPTAMNFAETYKAMQTDAVDGQENPLGIVTTARFYEVQKHASLTNHIWDGFWILMNRRAWQALPEKLQEIVARHFNAGAELQRKDVLALNSGAQAELEQKGMTFHRPDMGLLQQKLSAAHFYRDWKAKYGNEAWSILEKAVDKSLA